MRSIVQYVSPACGPLVLVWLFASQTDPKPNAILQMHGLGAEADGRAGGAGAHVAGDEPPVVAARCICQSVPSLAQRSS